MEAEVEEGAGEGVGFGVEGGGKEEEVVPEASDEGFWGGGDGIGGGGFVGESGEEGAERGQRGAEGGIGEGAFDEAGADAAEGGVFIFEEGSEGLPSVFGGESGEGPEEGGGGLVAAAGGAFGEEEVAQVREEFLGDDVTQGRLKDGTAFGRFRRRQVDDIASDVAGIIDFQADDVMGDVGRTDRRRDILDEGTSTTGADHGNAAAGRDKTGVDVSADEPSHAVAVGFDGLEEFGGLRFGDTVAADGVGQGNVESDNGPFDGRQDVAQELQRGLGEEAGGIVQDDEGETVAVDSIGFGTKGVGVGAGVVVASQHQDFAPREGVGHLPEGLIVGSFARGDQIAGDQGKFVRTRATQRLLVDTHRVRGKTVASRVSDDTERTALRLREALGCDDMNTGHGFLLSDGGTETTLGVGCILPQAKA